MVVVFDLYDTLLKGRWFDFQKGVEYLYETYFKEVCTLEELREYSKAFLPIYAKKREKCEEINFVREELPFYFTHFGLPIPENPEAVEDAFLEHMKEDFLPEEVLWTLERLSEAKAPMYVLSNSIFTERAAEKHIARFGILPFFEKVFSSADYGVKKPGRAFFDLAVAEIQKRHPKTKREEIWFVGNDYELDAKGGVGAGLRTIWYNENHLPNEDHLPVWEIDDFREIVNIVLE